MEAHQQIYHTVNAHKGTTLAKVRDAAQQNSVDMAAVARCG